MKFPAEGLCKMIQNSYGGASSPRLSTLWMVRSRARGSGLGLWASQFPAFNCFKLLNFILVCRIFEIYKFCTRSNLRHATHVVQNVFQIFAMFRVKFFIFCTYVIRSSRNFTKFQFRRFHSHINIFKPDPQTKFRRLLDKITVNRCEFSIFEG